MLTLTSAQVSNLRTLSAYLRAMSPEYARTHFLMETYAACLSEQDLDDYGTPREAYNEADETEDLNPSSFSNQEPNSQYVCGTCACAVGHGPAAGIPVTDSDDRWDSYSWRAFGLSQLKPASADNWEDLFGPNNEDDPYACADRIDAFLAAEGERYVQEG